VDNIHLSEVGTWQGREKRRKKRRKLSGQYAFIRNRQMTGSKEAKKKTEKAAEDLVVNMLLLEVGRAQGTKEADKRRKKTESLVGNIHLIDYVKGREKRGGEEDGKKDGKRDGKLSGQYAFIRNRQRIGRKEAEKKTENLVDNMHLSEIGKE
jgi:hypothetical protein